MISENLGNGDYRDTEIPGDVLHSNGHSGTIQANRRLVE
jgi:hypothetical protein